MGFETTKKGTFSTFEPKVVTKQHSLPEELLIGAHNSIAGGLHNALNEAKSIGATTAQIFTSNQRQWKGKKITEEEIELFQETLKETKIKSIMSHGSYLINLATPDRGLLEKSQKAFNEEIERCLALGLKFLNFHPGAATDGNVEYGLDRIVESLLMVEDYFVDDSLRLLLETTAGQGTSLGSKFEQLAYILEKTKKRIPIGVCIDTCHIFVAGYDIRTEKDWKATLAAFESTIGLKNLYAFHLNDSVAKFNSKVDRHAHLGEGEIGLPSFKYLMTHDTLRELPKYLETPKGIDVWDKEIWMLREYSKGTIHR